jgi:type VI secretion system protein ImpL
MTPLLLGAVLIVLVGAGLALAVRAYSRQLYAVPWLLLLGPTDAGKSPLVASALEAAASRRTRNWLDIAWRYIARQRGLRLSRVANGVVIDVAGWVAFPPGGADLGAWRRLLRLLTRYRRRRPVDGVILAIPAPLLLGEELRTQDLGAAIRERLTEAQGHFGFVLPVYVVVTQSDHLRGFAAFARAVPGLRQEMLGWSNEHAASALDDALAGDLTALNKLAFTGDWIAEGFGSLHRSIVQAQVEVFASSDHLGEAPDLFLFSGEVGRLANPLRALLEEVFRTSLYRESCFLRGFYLCGEGSPRGVADDGHGDTSPRLRASPTTAVNFIDDLIEQKVFPERGLAIPLPDVAVARLRSRLAAQVVSGVLFLGLAVGTTWSYLRLRGAQGAYAQVLTTGRQLQRNEQMPTRQEIRARLAQSRTFLERLQEVRPSRFTEILTTIFIPASVPTERAVSREASRVFNEVVLVDIRAGLELKGRRWLETSEFQAGDRQGPLGPALESTAPYKALDRFAKEYQQFVLNYQRYDRLRRGEGAADPSAPGELLAYLADTPLSSRPTDGTEVAKSEPIPLSATLARAVKVASAKPINCEAFEVDARSHDSLVALQASALLREFGARSFGDDSPLVAAANGFEADWNAASDSTDDRTGTEKLVSLIDNTTKLSGAVTAWAALGTPSRALPIPVFDRPPFKRLQPPATEPVCGALRPDLSAAIREVELLRDQLTDRLLAVEIEPFGPLLEEGDKGLALTKPVAALKDGLDILQREGFWPPQAPEVSGGLPPNPTWRPEAIDEVVKVSDAFNGFRTRAFGGLDRPYRDDLLRMVESEVAELVVTRLELSAFAAPPSAEPEARLEEITRLGEERLAKIEPLVGLLSTQPFGLDILRRLDDQANLALQYIDRTASTRYPSIFARRTGLIFTEWATLKTAAPAAPDALKRWGGLVDDQREGARQFANQARPIVKYLATRSALVGRAPSEVVQRWAGIAADVANYDQKRPNALSALDTAMRDGVPAIVPEKDCVADGSNGGTATASGFFAGVRQEIAVEGVRRCRASVEDRYSTIAAAFNRLLSGRFPFSRSLDGAAEATAAQAAEFLRVYEASGGRSLRQPLQTLACSESAVTFIQRMNTASALLASVAPSPPGGAEVAERAITLDVVPVAFRVARDLDDGGDQIADWTIEVGRQTFLERGLVSAKPAPWASGDPVNLTLRFARDSPTRPTRPVAGAPFARVQDRSLRFEFRGAWALFGLLRSGRAVAAAEASGLREAAPIVLGFEVPVERDLDPTRPPMVGAGPASTFKVYMRIRVFQSGKTDPLSVDEFPTEAPLRASCPGA